MVVHGNGARRRDRDALFAGGASDRTVSGDRFAVTVAAAREIDFMGLGNERQQAARARGNTHAAPGALIAVHDRKRVRAHGNGAERTGPDTVSEAETPFKARLA